MHHTNIINPFTLILVKIIKQKVEVASFQLPVKYPQVPALLGGQDKTLIYGIQHLYTHPAQYHMSLLSYLMYYWSHVGSGHLNTLTSQSSHMCYPVHR